MIAVSLLHNTVLCLSVITFPQMTCYLVSYEVLNLHLLIFFNVQNQVCSARECMCVCVCMCLPLKNRQCLSMEGT